MSIWNRFANLFRSERLSGDIDRELSFHIRERVEELMENGMSEREAIATARRQFGNPTVQAEETRDADVIQWIDSVMGDVRYAVRALLRSPVFTSVAIASLALGIGANTAIYTLIDAVIVRPLPVPRPQELLQLSMSDNGLETWFTNPMWEQIRDRQTGFASITAMGSGQTLWNVADGGEVRRIRGMYVSGDYFTVFGMRPALGRLLTRADDVRGCPAIGVLGYGFWQSEYGGRADVIGRTIPISGTPIQIVGVVAKGFTSPEVGVETHLFAPLCSEAVVLGPRSALDRRSSQWIRIVGRRDESLTTAQVRARLHAIAKESYAATVAPEESTEDKTEYLSRSLYPLDASQGMSALRTRYATALKLMMGAVALVLLIACANVANLLLARAAAREREVSIRLAIGAGRRRLVRQLLTESALLAGVGALGGFVVAHWGTRALVALISTPRVPVALDLGMNVRIFGFTVLAATVTAILFGLIPAWRGTRVDPQIAMKAHGRGVATGVGTGRFTLGKALVVAQVALSLTLLVGGGLLIGSLKNLRDLDPGFRPDGVLLASVNLTRTRIPQEQLGNTRRGLVERLRAMPGVRSAAFSEITPLGGMSSNDQIFVNGFTPAKARDDIVWFNDVSDGYLAAMDMRLLAGRDFTPSDATGPRAAIVDELVAQRFFGGTGSALGKQFRTKEGDDFTPSVTVVGVVRSAKYRTLRETNSLTIFRVATSSDAGNAMTFAVRGDGDALALSASVKAAVAEVHELATVELRTLSDQVATSLSRDRVLALLSGLFGGVALMLSMLGLYGVMAYSVARRRNEIGVRIALGAASTRVVRMVLGDVARVVLVGAALGLAGAVASGKLLASFLYGVEAREPAVLAGATVILVLVALAAGMIPALRAARVDPVAALRED